MRSTRTWAIAERLHDPAIAGEAWNVSCEQPQSVLEMTQRVLAAAGRDDLQPIVLAEARHEIPNQYLAATKLRDRLGWSPSVGLEEGLTRNGPLVQDAPGRTRPGPNRLTSAHKRASGANRAPLVRIPGHLRANSLPGSEFARCRTLARGLARSGTVHVSLVTGSYAGSVRNYS